MGGVFVEWIINICSIVLTDCAVPMFFVISGYLFFLRQDDGFTWAQYKAKMLRKCKILLLPFFIWNILGALSYPSRFIDATLTEKLLGFWSQRMEWGSWAGPWDGPLWFLRDLFVVMLFSPFIYWIIKRIGIWFIVVMLVWLSFIDNESLCPGLSGTALLWFSLGSYLSIKKPTSFGKIPMNIVVVLAAVFFVCRLLVMGNVIDGIWGDILNITWILTSMAFYFRLAYLMAERNVRVSETLKRLGASSFVIFAMHSLINGRISSVLLFMVGKQNVGDLLTITFYFATIILTVAMHSGNFACEELPPCRVIKRITSVASIPSIPNGKIAIVIGSHRHFSQKETDLIDKFCSEYNAVVFADHTSNYNGKYSFNSALLGCQFHYNSSIFDVDLIIHIGEVSADVYSYSKLKSPRTWRISEDGEMRDRFRNLEYVFEMSVEQFMEGIAKGSSVNTLYNECSLEYKTMFSRIPEIPFSNIWIANTLHDKMPEGSLLYFSILNSLRAWNFFDIHSSITTSCNVGGFGIDGPLSTALGAAIACPDKTTFIVTGDLAFFYDLNVLGNRHMDNNMRILLINNGCGTEFRNYDHPASYWGEEANLYMAAGGHFGKQSRKLVKDFVENLGFEYLSASSKEDFMEVYPKWIVTTSDKPIMLEVFTNSADESVALDRFRNIVPPPKGQQIKEQIKITVKELVGNDILTQVKKIIKK